MKNKHWRVRIMDTKGREVRRFFVRAVSLAIAEVVAHKIAPLRWGQANCIEELRSNKRKGER